VVRFSFSKVWNGGDGWNPLGDVVCHDAEGRQLGLNTQKLVVNDYAIGILVLRVTTMPQDSYFDCITESHRDRPTS
jgi:hypothetical protein